MSTATLACVLCLTVAVTSSRTEAVSLVQLTAQVRHAGRDNVPDDPAFHVVNKEAVSSNVSMEDALNVHSLRYMPEENIAVCSVGKCGTSSLYRYIYEHSFGHAWDSHPGPKTADAHDVLGEWWEGKFVIEKSRQKQNAIMTKAYSFALIRDPAERLVSAWKSKVACGKAYGTDPGRPRYVKELLELSGRHDSVDCLELEDYLEILYSIHQAGKASLLGGHFIPQHLACFVDFPPQRWSKVAAITDPQPFAGLSQRLGGVNSDGGTPPRTHASKSKVTVTPAAASRLNVITKDEYALLRPYLKQHSQISAGARAFQVPMTVSVD